MSGGIISQYGFLFQKYVFIDTVVRNASPNAFFTYEGVDDIDLVKENNTDSLIEVGTLDNEFLQVKSGHIDRDCWSKVVGNWLLNDDFNNVKFALLCENEISFGINDTDVIEHIFKYFSDGKNKSKNSIARKVYDKFFAIMNEEQIKQIINDLILGCQIQTMSFDELKSTTMKLFIEHYCTDIKQYEKAKEIRFERFVENISSEIDLAISKKSKYTIRYNRLMEIITGICVNISDKKYKINETEIKKRKRENAEKLVSESSIREIKQLLKVKNDIGFVTTELVKELLYKDFREVYAQGGIEISNMEDRAHTNYEDAILELRDYPTAYDVFLKTTRKKIDSDILDDNPTYRNGCYIYLTGDDIESDLQISWEKNDK